MSQEQQIFENNMTQVPLLNTSSVPIESPLVAQEMNETKSEVVINLDENTENKLTNNDLNSVSGCVVFDEAGNPHTMGEIWSE